MAVDSGAKSGGHVWRPTICQICGEAARVRSTQEYWSTPSRFDSIRAGSEKCVRGPRSLGNFGTLVGRISTNRCSITLGSKSAKKTFGIDQFGIDHSRCRFDPILGGSGRMLGSSTTPLEVIDTPSLCGVPPLVLTPPPDAQHNVRMHLIGDRQTLPLQDVQSAFGSSSDEAAGHALVFSTACNRGVALSEALHHANIVLRLVLTPFCEREPPTRPPAHHIAKSALAMTLSFSRQSFRSWYFLSIFAGRERGRIASRDVFVDDALVAGCARPSVCLVRALGQDTCPTLLNRR